MVMAVMGLREAWRWLVTLGLVWSLAASGGRATTSPYTSQWAAHIQGGPTVASQVADRNGFTLLAEIFPDFYHLEHRKVAKRSLQPDAEYHGNLLSEKQVKWAKQQRVRRRRKRDYMTRKDLGLPSEPSPTHVFVNDPRWPQMWYLNRGSGLDMSVEGAWKEGITGKGIVVTILDDGLEKDHPDLKENYDPQASYDVNGRDENPMPRYDMIDSNRHGTRCAGEVAAVANNSLCSLGIAYRANVGGVRMLDGDVTDAVEARSLSLNPQHIDIYSASWGPDDDGKTVDGPGELAMRAFIEGVTKGRGGRGSIFVWASGNGGRDHDNCNCDGYTNSIWTLSISSATENGLVPWYSEACSSTLATTYSSGSNGEKQVVTTDLHHQCTSGHTGTSASAPLAAGICALALEANNQLTWRDMQHIVVATARPANLKAYDWTVNGVGRNVSHSFGYGLMDAASMVKLARKWRTVPEQHKCEVSAPHTDKVIPAKSSVTLQLNVKECAGVNYLEHVQAKITLSSLRRGDIEIQLTSPAGTKTTLLAKRPHDISRSGFRSWPFMSVHTWGEHPLGVWTLEIHNEGRLLAKLTDWNQIFYGTETAPGTESKTELPPIPTGKIDEMTTAKSRTNYQQQQQKNNLKGQKQQQNSAHSSSPGQWTSVEIMRDMSEESGVSTSGCQISTRSCLECSSGLYVWNGRCEATCPEGTFLHRFNGSCQKCHYSCLNCSGPSDFDCLACHGDSYLYYRAGSGVYCYPKSVRGLIDVERWYFWILIGLGVNVVLLLMTLLIYYCRQKGCRCRNSYDKHVIPVIGKSHYNLALNDSDSEN